MPYPRYTDIACSVKTIDWLEAEILGSIASLYRSLARADEDPRVADLANAIIGCYLLAKRLGISYAELDEQINGNIRENIESGMRLKGGTETSALWPITGRGVPFEFISESQCAGAY